MKQTSTIDPQLDSIIKGINIAADVVISTMGGSGRNVILAKTVLDRKGDPVDEIIFTKDGVSVASKIKLKDNKENIGAQLLINAANKTVKECGDGTTLTSLFVKEFTNSLFKEIQTNETDINNFLEDVRNTIDNICEELIKRSTKIESVNDVYNIASTSSKSPKIASLIKEIFTKTGLDANISLEESRTSDRTYYEITEGLHFESGMIHPKFANKENGTCVFEKCAILIEQENVAYVEQYQELFDELRDNSVPLVIIAPSFSDNFIRYCLTNKLNSGFEVCLIKSPGYGKGIDNNRKDIIAFMSRDGKVNRIVINDFEFTIYNQTDGDKIKARTTQLKKMAQAAVESYDEQDYLNRINRLKQISAIIYVGGITEKNAKEEYDRIEDSIGAIKSSFKNGYVRGAGVEIIDLAMSYPFELTPGQSIVKEVLKKPYWQILKNANYNPNVIFNTPYNTKTKQHDENIIDSTYVVINALQNSFALVELLINTSYIIYNE